MISATEANGLRQLLQIRSPPRGTPSRVLSARLRRCRQHHCLLPAATSTRPSLQQPSPGIACFTKRFYRSNSVTSATAAAQSRPDLPEILGDLLNAVQSQDAVGILTELKRLGRHSQPNEVEDALGELPPLVFSELVRSLDPIRVGPKVDASHGLLIQSGHTQFSSVASVFDKFGTRKIYHIALRILRSVLELRLSRGHKPTSSDCLVLLRCAGAASDIEAAKWVWKEVMRPDSEDAARLRNGLAHAEFFKARFLTEEIYMQNDLARFRVRPRDLAHRKRFADRRLLRPLERLRLSIFANRRTHYGRSRTQATHDMHRLVSLAKPIVRTWNRLSRHNAAVSEELYCGYLIACSRAGSFRGIIRILWKVWGMRISELKDHRNTNVIGGFERRALNTLVQPTERLLNAVVHSFSSLGFVILARKMLLFISARYQIPIPSETWSLLLESTYIMSAKPAKTEWKIVGDPNRVITSGDVLDVWETMTSEPFKVDATPKDVDVQVKSLIEAGRLEEAWDVIRRGCAHYDAVCQDVETALFERLFPSPPPEAITRHLQAKSQQHATWYAIQRWCWLWLRKGSKRHRHADVFSSRIITDFVAEFRRFLPNPITYQTRGGTVRMVDPGAPQRHNWSKQIVESPPTQIRAPDPSRPKFMMVETEDGGEVEVPVLTESGEQHYLNKSITLRRRTEKFVRQRTEKTLGQQEKKLALKLASLGDEEMDDPAGDDDVAKEAEEARQMTTPRGIRKDLIMRSLTW